MRRLILILSAGIILWACPRRPPCEACREFYLVEFSGENEIPETPHPAEGEGILEINRADSTGTFRGAVAPLNAISGFHFHLGKKNENGPVIVTLQQIGNDSLTVECAIFTFNTVFGSEDFQGEFAGRSFAWFLDAIKKKQIYANVHTPAFSAGATRGQALRLVEPED